jgi:hypothetical protein
MNKVMNFGIMTFVTDEVLRMVKRKGQSGRPKARCPCLRG